MTALDTSGFTGTTVWYRHALAPHITYTEGVKYVADTAGAYWLLDEVVLGQRRAKIVREPFQVWKLAVGGDRGATLRVEDGNDNLVFEKTILFTDFPGGGDHALVHGRCDPAPERILNFSLYKRDLRR